MSAKSILLELSSALSVYDIATSKYLKALSNKSLEEIAKDINLWGGAGSITDQISKNELTLINELSDYLSSKNISGIYKRISN
ncbi:MAG: hypothetical protein HWE16_07035 [Gammaproteobacteria bacterium]|nr:hypothetical protein [Gammaproteobacteria bacterium]